MVTYFTGSSALTVNITKDIESLSLDVQWDAVEDFIDTTYTLVLSSETNPIPRVVTLTEQMSYTITGLTLDTVYTITVSAVNKCGHGPEFTTSILLAADNIFTISSISPTTTAFSIKIAPTSYYVPSTTIASTEETTSSEGTHYYCHYYIYCQCYQNCFYY